jgi:hypothetical protein
MKNLLLLKSALVFVLGLIINAAFNHPTTTKLLDKLSSKIMYRLDEWVFGSLAKDAETNPGDVKGTMNVCENGVYSMICPAGQVISIRSVFYGRSDVAICGHVPIEHRLNTHCTSDSALHVVQALCNNQQACEVPLHNSVLGGDPCPGTFKYARFTYSCGDTLLDD